MRLNLLIIFILTSFYCLQFASADQILLTNGDLIQGSVVEQNDDFIVWESVNFGKMTIAMSKVDSVLSSSTEASKEPVNQSTVMAQSIDPVSIRGTISLAGTFISGNEERKEWAGTVGLSHRQDHLRHRANFDYQFRQDQDQSSKENYNLTYAFDWFFKDNWFWSNNLSYGANDDRALDQFYTVSSLLGNQLWDNNRGALSLETGATWINETLITQIEEGKLTWNWSTNYRKSFFKSMVFSHSNQLLVAIEDSSDNLFQGNFALDFPLIDQLFTKVELRWIYDNEPPQGIEKIDRRATIGINYTW